MNEIVDRALTNKVTFNIQDKCHSKQLTDVSNEYFPHIKCLSLDCFDTILWRNVGRPTDVFYQLAKMPVFKKLGITAHLRVEIEETARRRKFLTHGTREVSLPEIYQAYSHKLTQQEINELIENEFNAELETCYGFHPIIDFISAAIDQKIKIIIVSDTYFSENQLKQLLEKHLPSGMVNKFSKIYVSNAHGLSKVNGLHKHVITVEKLAANRFLHIGDSEKADYLAAKKSGMHALQLDRFDTTIQEMMRMRDLGLGIAMPAIRSDMPLYHPFNALIADNEFSTHTPEKYIGYASLGPLMYLFANYIHQEAKKINENNKSIKILFLLRDAHLPQKIVNIIAPELKTYAVRISRFAAYAASFSTKQDIIDYVSSVIGGGRYNDIAKQLLIPQDKIDLLIHKIEQTDHKNECFFSYLFTDENVALILNNSKKYRQRLMRYLEKQADVKKDDTLMFIDLGYSGTTQTKLAPVFKAEYNIDIIGRYLLSLTTSGWQESRAGLLDPSHYDDRVLLTLVTYIAMLEQLCTTIDRSVIDFNDAGEPVFGDTSLNAEQHEKLANIQYQCEQFAHDVRQKMPNNILIHSPDVMRQSALAELVRLIYLPAIHELNYLNTFKFDLNLGTSDIIDMFDAQKGLLDLRRRGLFFMEKNLKTMRTNYPAELRSNGLELLLTMLAQHCFGLEFNLKDMSYRNLSLPIYVMHGNKNSRHEIQAYSTYDGYFSLVVPLGQGQFITAIALGELYKWVQIDAIETIPVDSLYGDVESLHAKDIRNEVVYDQLKAHGDGLYECLSKTALILLQPLPHLSKHNLVCRVTFRPIVTLASC